MHRQRIYHLTGLLILLIVVQLLFTNDPANAQPKGWCPPWCFKIAYATVEVGKGTQAVVYLDDGKKIEVKLSQDVYDDFKEFFGKKGKKGTQKLVGFAVLSVRKNSIYLTAFMPSDPEYPEKSLDIDMEKAPSANEVLKIYMKQLELYGAPIKK